MIGAICVTKVAQIFASGGTINGSDLALDAGNSVELSDTASRS